MPTGTGEHSHVLTEPAKKKKNYIHTRGVTRYKMLGGTMGWVAREANLLSWRVWGSGVSPLKVLKFELFVEAP